MSTTEPLLEIHVHLEDGRIARFSQTTPDAVHKVIEPLQPSKLYSQHHFTICAPDSLIVFPSARVVQLDFVGPDVPKWPHYRGIQRIQQLTSQEFQAQYDPVKSANAAYGLTHTTYSGMELTNGNQYYLEVTMGDSLDAAPPSPQEFNTFLQQLLTSTGLHFQRSGGGVSIINPAHIVRMSFYPGLSTAPPNAWPAAALPE